MGRYALFNVEKLDEWHAHGPGERAIRQVAQFIEQLCDDPTTVPDQRAVPGSPTHDLYCWVTQTNVVLTYRFAIAPVRVVVLKRVDDIDLWARGLG